MNSAIQQICAAREEDDALRDLRLDSPDAFLYLNQGEASNIFFL